MPLTLPLLLLLPVILAVACSSASQRRGASDAGDPPDGGGRDVGTADTLNVKGCVRVSRVIDGDTFDYEGPGARAIRVRMLGIDTPELRPKLEPCADWARNALSVLIGGQYVRLATDPATANKDDYDRELRYVSECAYEEPGRINLRMVEEGLACVRWAEGLRLEPQLRQAQQTASSTRTGCWDRKPNFCR